MVKLAILCHPCTATPCGDLEDWLEGQLERLRDASPQGIIRLARPDQELADPETEVGWVVELGLPEDSILLDGDGVAGSLANFITDMRFLGLQPKILTQDEPAEAPVLDYPGLK